VYYDGCLHCLEPFTTVSELGGFIGGNVERNTKTAGGGETATGFGITLKFRMMRRNTVWYKGSSSRARYISYGGPVFTLASRKLKREDPSETQPAIPAISVSVIPGFPPKEDFFLTNTSCDIYLQVLPRARVSDPASGHPVVRRPLADLEWHTLALKVTEKGKISLYIDGSVIYETFSGDGIRDSLGESLLSLSDIYVGAAPDAQFCAGCDIPACGLNTVFHGQIAHVSLWTFHSQHPQTLNAFGEFMEESPQRVHAQNQAEVAWKQIHGEEEILSGESSATDSYTCSKPDVNPRVLYMIGHLRTFEYTASLSSYLCPGTDPYVTVLATPSLLHGIAPELGPIFPNLIPDSLSVTRAWWKYLGSRLIEQTHRNTGCDRIHAISIPESSREMALSTLLQPLQEKWEWASIPYDNIRRRSQHPSFFMATTIRLTAYRYELLRLAHAKGMKHFREAYGKEMPENHLIIVSRPDLIMTESVPNLDEIVAHIRRNPLTVFGFWDGNDYFDDRILLTSRKVVEGILKLDHVCKWKYSWLNETSLFKMHVSNLSKEEKWGEKGPSVLWDFLLDLELVAEDIYAMPSENFGRFTQYSVCKPDPGLNCARAKAFGTQAKQEDHYCKDVCGGFKEYAKPINISWILNDRRIDWNKMWDIRHSSRRGEWPVAGRGLAKGYINKRVEGSEAFPRERALIRERCMTQ